ncbi:DUF7144 family membrane protein [Nocardia cyriacigeorgica]|jgi:hypothetical protein|uniref:DUF7144 family membrane protein n=1 Tax=Nocardia cyriacigeorgica TaxID=135487 RepID=UPI0013D1F4EF|nr:hypothetical protein [Nocardia cyriacigeorgica]MBF6434845.1 hypothetical protein [Nocardia cyriacigeorgica]MBF6455072.1 hypothetical protein [Nocardia cyriacigeorgica]MBF6477914.1 hypothetical protein [Nocardia cyriacigeorgica]MBF6552967.1 hypothetical protein [Nocardia cyriacigeorgica]NEW26763.1 hypothetical protein [Nocardia cyriacigeorgica]
MSHSTETDSPVKQGFAAGTSIGASILLLTVGVLSILQGISAVAEDQLFVVGIEYVYEFDTTTWGWIHIILGIVLVVSAIGLMSGTTWGRIAAVTIAALSIIANFLWLPYYPLWSILIIALNIVVIWAVTTWNPDRM